MANACWCDGYCMLVCWPTQRHALGYALHCYILTKQDLFQVIKRKQVGVYQPVCSAYGNRTRVPCVRGMCPSRQTKAPFALSWIRLRKLGDSNPRYGNPYVSLANWWFQPLTQTSFLVQGTSCFLFAGAKVDTFFDMTKDCQKKFISLQKNCENMVLEA